MPPGRPAQASVRVTSGDPWVDWPGAYTLDPSRASGPGPQEPRSAPAKAASRADNHPGWRGPQSPPWRAAEPPLIQDDPGWPVPQRETAIRVRPNLDRVVPGVGPILDTNATQVARRILAEANQRAAKIRDEAFDHVATSLADAEQQAAELIRRAFDQAAATLAEAESQAAEIRATLMTLSAELGGMAAYVTENLAGSPATEPTIKPAALPVARPVSESGVRPGDWQERPAVRRQGGPAAPPAARPAGKPKGRPRQYAAMRVTVIGTACLLLVALAAGTTEVGLHGWRFFIFRSVGTGETGPNGLQEDQGPGQPGAPGAHQLP
jgi:hypothetical protein